MPKGGPEVGNTVPIQGPNGEIMGYTTPEKYAEIEAAVAQSAPDPFANNPRFNPAKAWGYDAQGDFSLMDRPEVFNYNPELEAFQEGYTPPAPEYPTDGLSLGGPPGEYGGAGGPQYPPAPPPRPTPTPPPTTPVDQLGSGNLPPPDGAPGNIDPWTPQLSNNRPSWNWDYFQDKAPGAGEWGGYDADYSAFERYQPGVESPWGMPNVTGGNKEFYQQQFANLLRDDQDYRTRARAAALRGQQAQDNPAPAPDYDAMWESMGVVPREAATAGPGGEAVDPLSWSLNNDYNFTPQTTNREVIAQLAPILSAEERAMFDQNFTNAPDVWSQTNWVNAGDPNRLLANMGRNSNLSPEYGGALTKVFNNLYRQGAQTPAGAPSVPAGYVAPV